MVVLGQRISARNAWTDAGSASDGAALRPARRRRTEQQDEAAHRLEILAQAVRAEVVPRLVLARQRGLRATESLMAGPRASDIQELAAIAMTRDVAPAMAFVEARRLDGLPLETLFLDLLAPTARHLGELWEQDLADFGTVTLGLMHLHHVLRGFGPAFRGEVAATGRGLHALLAPVPGEQHGFGLSMVAEFFRRGGWSVAGEAMTTRRELVALVRRQWFAVVGLSLATEARLEALADCIRALRQASRNPAIGVLVGGPIFVAHPELVALVGADATAADARLAVTQAQRLLASMPGSVANN